jgi:5-methylcytosine-specific restriction endonuclease McrA
MDVWRYPASWPAISKQIRERDGFRCRWCGAGEGLFDLDTGEPIHLTAMHLDGDPWNCEEWNIVSACRSCHAAYDAPQVSAARSQTRYWQRIAAGQLELFPFQH